ncbi:MAG: sugar transferase [Lachnospiraceae bacterium]|nr:sugar transferase [Lachnospiraceae bacterium]
MYKRGAQGWLKHLDFIMLDLVCLQLAFLLAYAARMGSLNPYATDTYRSIGIIILLADIIVSFTFNTFKNVLKRGYYRELAITIKHVCLVESVLIVFLFTIRQSSTYSRIVIYLMAVLYLCLGYFTRIFWKKHLIKVLAASKSKRSLVVVTMSNMAEKVLENIRESSYEQFRIAGFAFLDKDMVGERIGGIKVIANRKNLADAVCHEWVDEALIVMPVNVAFPDVLVGQLAQMGIVVHLGLFERSELSAANAKGERKQFIENLGNYLVLTTTLNYATPLQQFLKRSVDILGGLVGTLITGLLILIIGPMIYITSPGPIFFKQVRVGTNGKRFKIYKFRSMYMDAEERKKELMEKNNCKDGMMFKMDNDPRIIGSKIMPDGTVKKGFGNFIRDYSLDEFPQFLNVLKGDMSLVGTRPPTVDEWEKYELHHRARLAIRPGITGLWQVSGRSNITDFEEVVKLDTEYITKWSMGLDCRILLQTIGVVFGKKGAK